VPSSNANKRKFDDIVYQNVRKSELHSVVARVLVLPCSETIGWLINHTDIEETIIKNEEG
jgi:hypothetical protein